MKTRISKKLSDLKKNNQKAFIPYITAGFPNLATSEKIIYKLSSCGAAVIELGIPFSDPMADGPTIQKAGELALKKGINLKKIFTLVKKVRQKITTPILLMGYYNSVFRYGLEKFASDCKISGVDGVLIVDLPPEESLPLKKILKKKSIDLIYLLTPTSTTARINMVKKLGSGFVYYVSFTGITGALGLNIKEVATKIKFIKQSIKIPINIGFGISTPEHVKALSPLGDGVIVGSSIISLIGKCKSEKEILKKLEKYVLSLMAQL